MVVRIPVGCAKQFSPPSPPSKRGTPDQDSNLDFSVIGSPVYCKGSALDHAAIETRSGSEL
uniref:Uncharacterized protein n=1 Tax=Timema monikensis TaxID=170555 RepID=A0A7R9E9H3_9NEOP|nr:unnamed protein product [Timema monikensis]